MDMRSEIVFEVQGQHTFIIHTFLSAFGLEQHYLSCLCAHRLSGLPCYQGIFKCCQAFILLLEGPKLNL